MKDLATLESMKQEMSQLERTLEHNKRRQEALRKGGESRKYGVSVIQQLYQLDDKIECLSLQRAVAKWAVESASRSQDDLSDQIRQCLALGELLFMHPSRQPESSAYGKLYSSLWKEEYEPLHNYVRANILNLLRGCLEKSYPCEEGCEELVVQCQQYCNSSSNEKKNVSNIAWCCEWLDRLQIGHEKLVSHMNPGIVNIGSRSDVVMELCRPLLERLRFHFVDASEDRMTSTRIDRLPEWLFNYVKEHVFEGGPWDLVVNGLAPVLDVSSEKTASEFRNEIVRLVQWVLVQRNFFRHAIVAGPDSNPRILCNAIEQLMSFDTYTRNLLPSSTDACAGLTDTFIVSDDELWQWWLDREREWALSTLFQTAVEDAPTAIISPRAELFSAIMRSFKCKADVLSSPSSYLGQVAVPACMQFLDAVHASSTDLKDLMCQRGADLEKNARCWMELINGTHLASLVLTAEARTDDHVSDSDMARVGRSMERLRDALVEDYTSMFVETVLMERAKLASYLMRCPHLLSTPSLSSEDTGLSPDLHEVVTMLSKVVGLCTAYLSSDGTSISVNIVDPGSADILRFAPRAIRSSLAVSVSDKFMEVALDAHGMTPDIILDGATAFARDVDVVISVFGQSERALYRLMDVTKFMTVSSSGLRSFREALLGLVQYREALIEGSSILSVQQFSADNTLFDEAMSMIKAKGFAWLELDDAISIINRRKDSF